MNRVSENFDEEEGDMEDDMDGLDGFAGLYGGKTEGHFTDSGPKAKLE